jgi:hypothetical protein
MGKKMNKCKAPGCSKWVVRDNEAGYCLDHQKKLDPLSSLYVDKSPEQEETDRKIVDYFVYLLHNRSLEEMLF